MNLCLVERTLNLLHPFYRNYENHCRVEHDDDHRDPAVLHAIANDEDVPEPVITYTIITHMLYNFTGKRCQKNIKNRLCSIYNTYFFRTGNFEPIWFQSRSCNRAHQQSYNEMNGFVSSLGLKCFTQPELSRQLRFRFR